MISPRQSQSSSIGSGADRTQFERALAIARRNAILLLVCFLTVPAAALAYSLAQTSEYTGSASLLFRDPRLDEKLFGTPLFAEGDSERTAATNLRLVSLEQIAQRTAESLPRSGLTAEDIDGQVEVVPEGESDLIAIKATDEDPELAARLANEFARQYIGFRRDADRDKVRQAQDLVEAKLDDLATTGAPATARRQLEQQARELEILASLQTGNAELVQPATTPDEPSSPRTRRNVALGLLLGLLLGVGLALLREQLDRRLRDLDDVESLFDLPVLGTVPQSRTFQANDVEIEPTSAEGEAFRTLRASLRYFNVDRKTGSILVTSASPQDGKTTLSWNLALAEARAGGRVLLIEADLRRPTLAAQLSNPPSSDGLSAVLAGMLDAETAIQTVDGVDVLLAGPLPPNPGELIESDRMRQILEWAEAAYDRVIVDTPPAAIVSDAAPLIGQVAGVMAVVRLNHTPREAAEQLRDLLENIGAPVLGLVVNGASSRPDNGYYHSGGKTRFSVTQPNTGVSASPGKVTESTRDDIRNGGVSPFRELPRR